MSTFARRSLFCSVVMGLGFGLSASAQETPKSGETPSSASAADFPYEGEVTCENLNVRLAPRIDAATGVVAVLRQGEKVIAIGTSGEFLVVKAPRGASAWISTKHVKREADGSGTVLVNDAPLRMDSRAGAEKIGSLKEGERVAIAKEHLGWYQLTAPAGVKYYVAKKYVRFLAAVPGEVTEKTPVIEEKSGPSDSAALAKMREAQRLIDVQNKLISEEKVLEIDFTSIVTAFEEAVSLAKSEPVKQQAEADLRRYQVFNNMIKGTQGNIAALNKLVDEKKKENEQKYQREESKYEACGYVDTVGNLFYRPGAFKLVMSGKIIAFIKVKDGDEEMRVRMNRLYGKYVGVTGSVLRNPPGWPDHRCVTVETVEELIKK